MKIPEKSQAVGEVLEQLGAKRDNDVNWRDGRTFAYIFGIGEEATRLAEQAHTLFLWESALDPTVFPSTLSLETEIVAMAANHLAGDGEVVGNFTSGGTESVMLAVKTARDYARAKNSKLREPQMILPATAHPCFHKAAHYLDVKTVMVDVNPQTYRADVQAMEAAITDQTILLVGSATSYAHGVVDPIAELGQVALKHDLLLHVDACIGGFMLPLFRDLGAEITPFDFSVPGVTSISMDLHKYAFAPKGASTVLYRNDTIRQYQIFTWSDWPGYSIINPTIQSSKSGGPLAATWALLKHMGMEGYLREAAKLKGGMETIVTAVGEIEGLRVLGKPEMSLIAIACDGFSVFGLCEEMKKRGWTMHPQMKMGELEENFHLTLMPSNVLHLQAWVKDLTQATAQLREAGKVASGTPIRAMLDSVDLSKVTDGQLGELMAMAGLGGGKLPDQDMTEINEILNELPAGVRDRLLTIYFNKLSRYKGE